jgi:hypothetical protein
MRSVGRIINSGLFTFSALVFQFGSDLDMGQLDLSVYWLEMAQRFFFHFPVSKLCPKIECCYGLKTAPEKTTAD